MKCQKCEAQISDDVKYCPCCGAAQIMTDIDFKSERDEIINDALEKVTFSRTVWLIVALIQLVIGVATLLECYGVVVIILAVLNILKVNDLKEKLQEFRKNPRDMITYYDSIGKTVLFLLLNFFLGGVIGCIGNIYDISIRSYLIKHRADFY